jgi:hypothetical protein
VAVSWPQPPAPARSEEENLDFGVIDELFVKEEA